jgi:hypothetical protein
MFFRTTAQSEGESTSAVVGVQSEGNDASKTEPKSEAPLFKELKVNGKTVQVALDKLDSLAQLGMSATERFNEAKKLREEAQKILDVAKTEKSAMKSLISAGFSRAEAKAILEDDLRKEYEEEDLSPEEKARRAEKAELDKYRQSESERQKKMEEEASSKEELAELEKIDAEIAEAIEESDLPKNPILGKWALQYMSAYADNGEDLSAKEAMKLVNTDMKEVIRDMLSNMDASSVKQYLKSDHVKVLQEEVLKEYQSKQSPFAKPATVAKSAPAEQKSEGHTVIKSKDFFKY